MRELSLSVQVRIDIFSLFSKLIFLMFTAKRWLELEANEMRHNFVYMVEEGFDLNKIERYYMNIIHGRTTYARPACCYC